MADTVSTLNSEITIVGRKLDKCCDIESVPFTTRRFRMLFKHGFLFYKFYNIRLFFYLLLHKFDLIVSNDLDTLFAGFLASIIKRVTLIYDSHEYFTGLPELNHRPFVRWVWKSIEKMIFPHLKYIMTVSDSIAAQYEKEYGIRPLVIRNCSRLSSDIKTFTRDELEMSSDCLLLIFQGSGINIDKGGEELIEAIKMTENVSLLIIGSGDVISVLKQRVEKLNLADRIRFIQKVKWEELMRFTRSADAGLSLEKDTNLNYRFSLPNKLFDYISAGIPVITGCLPDIRKIIEDNGCGIIIPEITPEEIVKAIIKLRDDRILLSKLKQNSVIASESLNWDNESKKVIDFYKKILTE